MRKSAFKGMKRVDNYIKGPFARQQQMEKTKMLSREDYEAYAIERERLKEVRCSPFYPSGAVSLTATLDARRRTSRTRSLSASSPQGTPSRTTATSTMGSSTSASGTVSSSSCVPLLRLVN